MLGDDPMMIAAIIAFLLLIFLVIGIRAGLKDARERDLTGPPDAAELAGGTDRKRFPVLPERAEMALEAPEPVADPLAPEKPAIVMPPKAEIGDLETESSYTEDQLMEREVKAMLLQKRGDRAVKHVMKVKGVDEAEADAIVAELAD